MKLRNKKTGLDGELYYEPDKEYHFTVATEDPVDMAIYRTLAELIADWEDYKPAEPLIKDEKVRKAVRAWADINNIDKVEYDTYRTGDGSFCYTSDELDLLLDFRYGLDNLRGGNKYTIAELCGER